MNGFESALVSSSDFHGFAEDVVKEVESPYVEYLLLLGIKYQTSSSEVLKK